MCINLCLVLSLFAVMVISSLMVIALTVAISIVAVVRSVIIMRGWTPVYMLRILKEYVRRSNQHTRDIYFVQGILGRRIGQLSIFCLK